MVMESLIPKETRELFLPLYFSHPAAIYLRENAIVHSGISHASKRFQIHRIPDFCLILFTTGGQAVFEINGSKFNLVPGTVISAPVGIEQKYYQTGEEDWRFVWFHIIPQGIWDFLKIDKPVFGQYRELNFIEHAMTGFVSEVFSSAPHDSKRGPHHDRGSHEWREDMSEFNIPILESGEYSAELAEGHARLLVGYLQRELRYLLHCEKPKERYREELEQLWKKVGMNLEKEWTLEQLAERVNMSVPNFIRHVKSIYGSTPGNILRHLRLSYAARLLVESDLPIALIAENSGYESTSSFAALFKKHFTMTPREYRNCHE